MRPFHTAHSPPHKTMGSFILWISVRMRIKLHILDEGGCPCIVHFISTYDQNNLRRIIKGDTRIITKSWTVPSHDLQRQIVAVLLSHQNRDPGHVAIDGDEGVPG